MNEKSKKINQVILLGALGNTFLALVKMVVGVLGNSMAMIVDSIHSLSDLIIDFLVFIAARFSDTKATKYFNYGTGRVEAFATLLMGISILVVATEIAFAVIDSFNETIASGSYLMLLVVCTFVILIKELLYRFSLHIGKAYNSQIVISNALHHRSDAGASLVVLVGVIGSYFGLHFLDGVAAIVMTILIGKMGVELVLKSCYEFMEGRADIKVVNDVTNCVAKFFKVQKVASRVMGGYYIIDVHIYLDKEDISSIKEVHKQAKNLHNKVSQLNFIPVIG